MTAYDELVERVARSIRMEVFQEIPEEETIAAATAAIATILKVLQEADTTMLAAGQSAWNADTLRKSSTLWTAMLNASPLAGGK